MPRMPPRPSSIRVINRTRKAIASTMKIGVMSVLRLVVLERLNWRKGRAIGSDLANV